jgi:hypothetical protein
MSDTEDFITAALAYPLADCLPWPFATSGRGYPSRKGWEKVHRTICERAHGPAPSDMHECAHNCGNPACVNPNHLRWATNSENQLDRLLHGTDQRGEKHPNRKLTADEVRYIRKSGAEGVWLAAKLNVSPQTICDIQKRRSWKWLAE